MHSSISMRSVDSSIPDLPPSSFDYSASDFERDHLVEVPAGPEPVTFAPLNRQAIKIARALTGTSEIRLLRQKGDDQATTYLLEHAQLQPYHATRVELIKGDGDNRKPMSEAEAVQAYEEAVAEKYPATTLQHSGRSIKIHQDLLN